MSPNPPAPPFPKLVIASHNAGKLREIGALLAPFGVETVGAAALGLPEPDETEETFAGNALIKARSACALSGLPALSDDSGIEVFALGGEPGVHTADWAGEPRDFGVAMDKVEARLRALGEPDRAARFVCTLALVTPDGVERVFEGEVRGHVSPERRGDRGFGFDPVFVPDGAVMTFGEMDPAEKHAISHRADAFAKFVAAVFHA
jgi:XTP/dITP diphosphohydrolase